MCRLTGILASHDGQVISPETGMRSAASCAASTFAINHLKNGLFGTHPPGGARSCSITCVRIPASLNWRENASFVYYKSLTERLLSVTVPGEGHHAVPSLCQIL